MKREELEVGRKFKGGLSGRIKTVAFVGDHFLICHCEGIEESFVKSKFLDLHDPYDPDQELVGKSFKDSFGRVATVESVEEGGVTYSVTGRAVSSVEAFMKHYTKEVK